MAGARGVAARLGKAGEFLTGLDTGSYLITARPWGEPRAPYYIKRPLKNPDGHGGYTRANRFDDQGIPFSESQAGPVYHPLVVARYAMRMLDVASATGDAVAARRAAAMLPFLVASGAATATWGTGSSPDRMSVGRPSCIVQGVVISSLIRLCGGRPSRDLAALIDRAVDRLIRPVGQGGTLSMLAGGPFLEEMPGSPVSHILNGCLYGLFGLYDAADALGHHEAARVAREVEGTLSGGIAGFTAPLGWSYYALEAHGRRYLARAYYHATHIIQMRVLARRTGLPSLALAADDWERALRSTTTRLLFAGAKAAQVVWMRDIRRLPLEFVAW
ncbi:MAG TPA: D-glucuronyl C5-epimerase family protein [Candidatus Polarisedimenticolia bacterium]|jgi:hypothetical protein